VAGGLGDLDLVEHVMFAADRMGGDADESADFGLDDHSGAPAAVRQLAILTKREAHALP